MRGLRRAPTVDPVADAAEKKAKMQRLEAALDLWDGVRQRRANGERVYDSTLEASFRDAGIELGDRHPLEVSVRTDLQYAWQEARYEHSVARMAEVALIKREHQAEFDVLQKRVEHTERAAAQARADLSAFRAAWWAQGVDWQR